MILKPHVEECILAGPTPPAAVARFKLEMRKAAKTHDVYFALPVESHIWSLGARHVLGAVRVGPPLKAPERFKAIVNWWPVDERTEQ